MNIFSEFVSGLFMFGTWVFISGIVLAVSAFFAVRLVLRRHVNACLTAINNTACVITEARTPGEADTSAAKKSAVITLEEEPFLFDTTVFENIKYGKIAASDEEITAAAERAGIAYLLNENCENLTKGERQLVAAARAILFAPKKINAGRGLSAADLLTIKNLDL